MTTESHFLDLNSILELISLIIPQLISYNNFQNTPLLDSNSPKGFSLFQNFVYSNNFKESAHESKWENHLIVFIQILFVAFLGLFF